MATAISRRWARGRGTGPIAPDGFERVLAGGAIVLLAAVVAALARGYRDWPLVPVIVWTHLATVVVALALTPVLLLERRATRRHRVLGTIWIVAMTATAALSFGVRLINHGGFSAIHLLSAVVLVVAPLAWWAARTHRVATHRQRIRALVTGALLTAGFFTLPFGRMLGRWLFA